MIPTSAIFCKEVEKLRNGEDRRMRLTGVYNAQPLIFFAS
jgi:hypothetical protein